MKPRKLPPLSYDQKVLFLSKIAFGADDECWPWLGSTTGRRHSTLRYGTWKITREPCRLAQSVAMPVMSEESTDSDRHGDIEWRPRHDQGLLFPKFESAMT